MNRRLAAIVFALVAAAVGCASKQGVVPAAMPDDAAPVLGAAISADGSAPAPFEWGARALADMKYAGPADARDVAKTRRIYIQLKMRNVNALLRYATQASQPGNALYRQFLTPQEIATRFGATAADQAKVVAYFERYGMRVDVWPQRELVRVTGTLSQLARAFHTNFARYRYGSATAIAPAHPPRFDRALPVTAVVNLLGYTPLASVGPIRAGTQEFSGYTPQQLSRGFDYTGAYSFGYTGAGITVGVLAVGQLNQGDAPLESATYSYKLANIVLVTPFPIATQPGATPSPGPTTGNDSGEVAIDTQIVAMLAPRATEQFIFDQGDGYGELELAIAKNAVDTISYSAGNPESYSLAAGTVNASGTGSFQVALATLAIEGIAFFASSGDNGSTTQPCTYTYLRASCVTYPASDPNAVAVGAVNAPLDDAGNLIGQITAWSTYTSGGGPEPTPPGSACNCIGSGGGYSIVATAPPWQRSGLGVSGAREVPDMALDGDPKSGSAITHNGVAGLGNGTSMAAPMANAQWGLVLAACKASPACSTAKGAKPYRLGNPAPLLYAIYRNAAPGKLRYKHVFYDVLYGDNQPTLPTALPSPVPSPAGYMAGPGYDLVTGLGVPFTGHLIDAVVPGAGAP
jgi:subtilase family serine protease